MSRVLAPLGQDLVETTVEIVRVHRRLMAANDLSVSLPFEFKLDALVADDARDI